MLTTVNVSTGASIYAGQEYFVIVVGYSDTWDAWKLNDQGYSGLLLEASGQGSLQHPGQTLGGFRVPAVTPEPSTLLLLGSGLLGTIRVARNKRKR